MKIPKHVIEATRHRSRTPASAQPFRMVQPVADDTEEPTAQPAAPWSEPHPAAVAVPRQVVPGDLLYDALMATGDDDASRQLLLASASVQAREQFHARMAYVEMCDGARREVAAFEAFIASLRDASDDETRTVILARASHPHLVELGERLREPDPCERYMEMMEVSDES